MNNAREYDGCSIINASGTITSYCPLVVHGNGWKISFQKQPEKKIILEGKPAYLEILESISNTNITTCCLAEIIEICAELHKEDENE